MVLLSRDAKCPRLVPESSTFCLTSGGAARAAPRVELSARAPHCPWHMDTPTSANITADQVRRFIFENQPVRGHWVHLEGAWRELRAHSNYPAAVTELLGQAVVASVLL